MKSNPTAVAVTKKKIPIRVKVRFYFLKWVKRHDGPDRCRLRIHAHPPGLADPAGDAKRRCRRQPANDARLKSAADDRHPGEPALDPAKDCQSR